MDNETAKSRAILLFEYGSRAHGTNMPDSDTDFMGIAVEPIEYVCGMNKWEQSIINTANNVRSTSEDTDMTIYSLKKWASLAAKGNPTVLTALFAPEYKVKTDMGRVILDNADIFISKEAGYRFAGYMNAQRKALLGEKTKRTNRPELVDKHGYDTKFAYHMIRLGIQGIELMDTGRLELPFPRWWAQYLLNLRCGLYSKESIIEDSWKFQSSLMEAIEKSSLPERSDTDSINKMLAYIYQETWKGDS